MAAQLGVLGAELKGAHALTDHVALVVGGAYDPRTQSTFDSSRMTYNDHSHVYGEVGGGYFATQPASAKGKPTGNLFVYELFGGLGYGHSTGLIESETKRYSDASDNSEPLYVTSLTGNYLAPYAQVDAGLVSESLEFAFVVRFTLLDYLIHSVNGYPSHETRLSVFTQPAVVLRFGSEVVKLELQAGGIVDFSDSSRPMAPSNPGKFGSVGLFVRFGRPAHGK